jgi:hypothetical protein
MDRNDPTYLFDDLVLQIHIPLGTFPSGSHPRLMFPHQLQYMVYLREDRLKGRFYPSRRCRDRHDEDIQSRSRFGL